MLFRSELKRQYERQRQEAEAKAAAAEARRAAEVEAVKAQLARERALMQKENDRQEQIERHRRRLYPDYYETREQPATRRSTAVPPPDRAVAAPPPVQPPAVKKPAPALSEIKPLTYFNVDNEDDVPFLMELPPK